MMTTLIGSVNNEVELRQLSQQAMQLKANEKSAAEELKAEEQQQLDSISIPGVSSGVQQMGIRMYNIQKAADAGLLRPVWLERTEMDPNMPRLSDMISRPWKKPDDIPEQTANRTEGTDKSERAAAYGAEGAVKSEPERTSTYRAEGIAKSEPEQAAAYGDRVDVRFQSVADNSPLQTETAPEQSKS